MFDNGLFGGMFDLNNDGKMDSFEKAAEFGFFMHMMEEEKSALAGTTEFEDMFDNEQTEAYSYAGDDIDSFDF